MRTRFDRVTTTYSKPTATMPASRPRKGPRAPAKVTTHPLSSAKPAPPAAMAQPHVRHFVSPAPARSLLTMKSPCKDNPAASRQFTRA